MPRPETAIQKDFHSSGKLMIQSKFISKKENYIIIGITIITCDWYKTPSPATFGAYIYRNCIKIWSSIWVTDFIYLSFLSFFFYLLFKFCLMSTSSLCCVCPLPSSSTLATSRFWWKYASDMITSYRITVSLPPSPRKYYYQGYAIDKRCMCLVPAAYT